MSRRFKKLCRYYFENIKFNSERIEEIPDPTEGWRPSLSLGKFCDIRGQAFTLFIAGKQLALKLKKAPLQPSLTVEELASTLNYLFKNAL
jgi:hypothetical protein